METLPVSEERLRTSVCRGPSDATVKRSTLSTPVEQQVVELHEGLERNDEEGVRRRERKA